MAKGVRAMKTLTFAVLKRAALFGLALGLGGAIAQAEEPAEKPVPPEVLKKYDKDGDGKLNDAEKAERQKDRRAEHDANIAKYDKDGDGKLNDEEKAAMRADKKKKAAE